MIWTMVQIGFRNLSRDRVAQALTFLLPVVFFTLFANIFGGQRNGTDAIEVAVVDEANSELSQRLVAALKKEKGLEAIFAARPTDAPDDAAEIPLDRARALGLVKAGDVPVAIVLPAGIQVAFFQGAPQGANQQADNAPPEVELFADSSDPIAPQVVSGLLQKVAMTAAPDLFAKEGIDTFSRATGGLTPKQQQMVDEYLPAMRAQTEKKSASSSIEPKDGKEKDDGGGVAGPIGVKVIDVLGEEQGNDIVSFYAAGIGVMFLLFTCAGAGGVMLEEAESGTLERLLNSRLGMTRLLLGKWLYILLLGFLALGVMFLYAWLVWGVDLPAHLPGYLAMATATSAAAAGFGLVLATISRSRAQLSGISTILILMMSALGGSMFPRFLMSERMQTLGLLTFNGWALDGFVNVFWRNYGVAQLWPQLLVLSGLTVVFLVAARLLARRWETV